MSPSCRSHPAPEADLEQMGANIQACEGGFSLGNIR